MPYDVTIITVKPNRHMDALKGIEPWLKANPRKGEFLACLSATSATSTRLCCCIITAAKPDLAADRDGVARDGNPFGCLELTEKRSTNTFHQFPFLPPLKAGSYGPISRYGPIY